MLQPQFLGSVGLRRGIPSHECSHASQYVALAEPEISSPLPSNVNAYFTVMCSPSSAITSTAPLNARRLLRENCVVSERTATNRLSLGMSRSMCGCQCAYLPATAKRSGAEEENSSRYSERPVFDVAPHP